MRLCRYLRLCAEFARTLFAITGVSGEVTKCRNTAIVLITLVFGNRGASIAKECDVSRVIARPRDRTTRERLISDVARSGEPGMMYVLMTDTHVRCPNGKRRYFPGHVFLLERLQNGRYRIYQSYINQFSLQDYIRATKCASHSPSELASILSDAIPSSNTFTQTNAHGWRRLTTVDLRPFLGCDASGIRLCYRWFSSTELTSNLERFLRTRSKELMVHQTDRTLPSFARTSAELSQFQSDIDRMQAMIGDRSESDQRS